MYRIIMVVDGIQAWVAGVWLGDFRLRRMKSSYYLISAASMLLGVPFMIVALFVRGRVMVPAIAVAAFFVLFNTAPLNAADFNFVGDPTCAIALAVEIFIHPILSELSHP